MNKESKIVTIIFLSLLVIFNLYVYLLGKEPFIINALNILFHEAGHWIYGIFGNFIGYLGGFLGEVTIPLIFLVYFRRQVNIPGQVFSWWWMSTAFYGTSIYIADARARVLPLIGGQGGHDWAYLLGKMSLLNSDIFISRIFVLFSLIITVYMIILIQKYWNIIHVNDI